MFFLDPIGVSLSTSDHHRRHGGGFSLFELLIALVLLGLVGGFVITRFGESKEKAYIDAMRSDLRNYALAQQLYYEQEKTFGEFPDLKDQGEFSLSERVVMDSTFASSERWYLRLGHQRVDATLCFMEGATGNQVIARRPACPGEDDLEKPTAVISYEPDPALTLETVTLKNYTSSVPSGAIRTSTWELPGGRTVQGDTAKISFNKSGEYEVKLTLEDAYRQTDETTTNVFVLNRPPQPDFTWSPDPPESLNPVQFDASASEDLDGSISSYSWDFGDGNTGSGETTEHTYQLSGKYDVQLVVTDDEGRADTLVKQLSTTNSPPTARFTASPDSATTTDEVTLDARNSSDADGDIVSYDWKLGDGTTATGDSIGHTYAENKVYDVELVVEDNQGDRDTLVDQVSIGNTLPDPDFTWSPESPLTDTTVVFNGSLSSDPDGTVEGYSWEFGDGGTGSGVQASHSYSDDGTYSVVLTVTDNDGGPENITYNIDVQNRAPQALFDFTPSEPTTSDTVQFDAGGSSDPDGNIDSYQWTFGDGNNGTGVSPEHSYSDDGEYVVNLTITDDDGDSHGYSDTVRVKNVAPSADYTVAPNPGQTLEAISFDASNSEDTDGTIQSYQWTFGDDNTGTGATTDHTYSDDGSYTTELIVVDDDGAADTLTQNLEIQNRDPNATFSFSPDPPRTQEQVSFDGTASSDDDGEVVGWEWDFGDGATASGDSTPTHTYAQDGDYVVQLTIFDDDGGADTYTDTARVQNRPPSADFTFSPDPAQTSETVQFDASGAGDQDGSIQSYQWNFGDGNTGTGTTPTHVYTDNGDYTIELTVTDDDGDTGTHQDTITVENRPPNVSFTYTPSSPQTDQQINFDGSATSDPDGSVQSLTWSFGDGSPTTTGDTAIHAYNDNGTYTVELTAMDDDGYTNTATQTVEILNRAPSADFSFTPSSPQTDETITFDGRLSSDSDGSIASWSWDFGDGTTATGSTPNHSYGDNGSYTVLLTVTDDDGATDQISKTVSATNRAPTSSFTYSPASPTTSETINFDGTGSSDADGSISSYSWTFGDGATATGATPGHAYTDDGSYTVELTVTDDDGSTHTSSQTVSVTNRGPSASFTYSPTSPTTNETVNFDGSGSSDPDGSVSSYSWNFGDGATGTGATAGHGYSDNGTYTVELTVTDDDGSTATTSQDITVTNQAPTASFTIDSQTIQTGESTTLRGGGSDPDGTISYYQWSIDGSTQTKTTSANRTVSWSDNGSHTIDLRVQDNDGSWSSWAGTKTITVQNQAPTASFTYSPTDPATNETIGFDGTGSSDPDGSIGSYSWDFGDGATGTGSTPTHSYSDNGTYTVQLTVADDDGASHTTSQSIAVTNQAPTASFTIDDQTLTTGQSTTLRGSGSDGDGSISYYQWSIDGNTQTKSTSSTRSVSWSDDGSHTIDLRVQDDDGAWSSWAGSQTITVSNQSPSASFSYTPSSPTTNETVNFDGSGSSDTDGSISSYSWDFGDGGTGTGISPGHVYGDNGSYTIQLTVTDDDGASNSTSQTVSITNQPPTASFTIGDQTLVTGQSTTLSGSGSDADGSISYYQWSIDGSTQTKTTSSSRSVSWNDDGSHTIDLRVQDDDGAWSGWAGSKTITVSNQGPSVSISCDGPAYEGETVTCTASASDSDGSISSYSWGDAFSGTSSSSSRQFSNEGTYTASVTVTDDDGATASTSTSVTINNRAPSVSVSCDDPANEGETITCTASASDPDGDALSYSWGDTFSGTSSSSSRSFSDAGTYAVSVTVTDDDGASDTWSGSVEVNNRAPSVSASCDDPALTSQTITCSASASDPDGDSFSYSWGGTFSGTTSSSSRQFSDDGSYSVSVTVTDDNGATDTWSSSVTVNNRAPTTGISASCTDLTCSINPTSENDPDGSIATWEFDFDGTDESYSTGSTRSHTFSSGGSKTLRVRVEDDDGTWSSWASATRTAEEPNSAPSVSISCPSSAYVGDSVTCTASGSDPDGDALSYTWSQDFSGTGTSSTETFSTTGTKYATVEVTDGNGGSDLAQDNILIEEEPNSAPTADYTPSGESSTTTSSCDSWSVSSTSSDSDGSIVDYDWSNGTTGSSTTISVCDDGTGSSKILSLTVTDDDGATDTVSYTFSHTYDTGGGDCGSRVCGIQ